MSEFRWRASTSMTLAEIVDEQNAIERAYVRANASQHAQLKARAAELQDALKAMNARLKAEREAKLKGAEQAKADARRKAEAEQWARDEKILKAQLRVSWPADDVSFEENWPVLRDEHLRKQAAQNAQAALERRRRMLEEALL